MSDIIDAVVESWMEGINIPQRFKSSAAMRAPIPDKSLQSILYQSGRHGVSGHVLIEGVNHTYYATYHDLRIWVGRNWNTESPTASGDTVLAAIRRVAHKLRNDQFADMEAQRLTLLEAKKLAQPRRENGLTLGITSYR